jgi:hypothetical protein
MSLPPDLLPKAPAPVFDPAAVRSFRFLDCSLDHATGRVELSYGLDESERFVEVVELGSPLPELGPDRAVALERALRLLHLTAGVSYYKTCFAPRIRIESGPIDAGLAGFLDRLYAEGLAEARWTNDIRTAPARFPVGSAGPGDAVEIGLTDGALVPVGGGKDSVVALESVRSVTDRPLLFSVGASPAGSRTAEVAGLPHRTVERRISPRLLELNHSGAYNGHVPVTAIISCLASIVALLEDRRDVVMANERSASVGSLSWRGVEVNHQYSKSWDFETRFAEVVRGYVAADLRYFSLLRPWSELAIARVFATMPSYHHAFTSCNRAFLLDPERRTAGWCGDCPKCRFVFLALAPFLPRRRLAEIFSADLLADPAQVEGFAALLGIEADKPMECVGEIEESRVAMLLVVRGGAWSGAAVVDAFAADPRISGIGERQVESVLAPQPVHAIPPPYERFADALG